MSHQPQQQQFRHQFWIPYPAQIDQHGMQMYQQRMAAIQQLYGGQIPLDKIGAAKEDAAAFANSTAQALMEAMPKTQLEEHLENLAMTQEAQLEATLPPLLQPESTSSSVSSEPPSSSSSPVIAQKPSKPRVRYQQDEKLWIEKEGKEKGSSTWAQLAKRFNQKFKPTGRPSRNRHQIRLQYVYLSRKEPRTQQAADETEDGEGDEVGDDEGDEMEDDEDTEADEVEAN